MMSFASFSPSFRFSGFYFLIPCDDLHFVSYQSCRIEGINKVNRLIS